MRAFSGSITWSYDDKYFFYTKLDKFHRARKIYRHILNTPIKNDELMREKTNKVLGVIDTFRERPLTQGMVKQILKIQNLTHEITK